uniref:DUF4218 domain-containing protein n=1 Tax=Tanacetum cinerariifolium TaxID=118510 RepID=A0A6L2MBR5_TANCI|nr:hypothetical protein [Tanacetum cinerariifolium]
MVKPKIGDNVNFEMKSQFMRELRDATILGNKNNDAYEHVERVLGIVSLFNILRVSHDAVMLRVFFITLTGVARRWVDRLPPETVDSWDLFKMHLSKECNGGPKIYGMDEEGVIRKWYCYHDDDDRKRINRGGLSFPEFLLVKNRETQEKELIWDDRFEEWCNNNPDTPTLRFTIVQENLNPRPNDYPFKDWLLKKVLAIGNEIRGEARLFYKHFARIHLLQSSFEGESNAQENHRKEEVQEGNNSPEIEILTNHVLGKDIDVYLRPLIEDLKVLWDRKGVETIDVASGQKFNMRAIVLWTINDFPARSSLSGWSGQGYKACTTCNKDTPSVRVLSKTAYVGHRRFLKKPHKLRSSREFNWQTDNRDPPKEFDRDEILAQLDRLPTRLTGKHPSFGGCEDKTQCSFELNWTKRSIFYELEYWSFLTLRHNLDIMHIKKNVLEAILNTLLMNDKSKDTVKARQDLQRLGIRSSLWLGQTKNGKCLKPQVAYSFTPKNRKKFCQFVKGVKLPDGFGSCFKHKVTDNDTNITGLKSHDCHIMKQRLLPYGLQNYSPDKIARPIIELCSLFKQICSATLMEDDMLKDQIKVVDILGSRRQAYFPPVNVSFERYIKKLKGYVRNNAKLEGSIAEGYVVEETLTFSSHYFQDVTTKFNRPDHNVDSPPLTCQFQVFRSICKSIGLRSLIQFDAQELKKVKCYVLHNSPEIDTYRSQFKRHERRIPRLVWVTDNDNDPEVSTTSELFALACGPTWTPISINSYVVDGVRYVVHSCDECRITQNSGIVRLALTKKCIMVSFKKSSRNNMTQIDIRAESFKDDQYILVTQVKQVLYLEDKAKPYWRVVEHVNHKKFSDGGVIVIEDDPDIIHFDNSSDLLLSTSLNDLDNETLHIDGQSTEVDVLPDIIDVVDEDDDITDDEDAIPHDLADSDNDDLINMSADVARSHGGDDRGKGKRKPNLGGRAACRLNTRDKTQNLSLKEITDMKGSVPIQFELRDKQTVMPLDDHAAHWSSYIEEVIRGAPLYYPSWLKVPKERKATLITYIGTQFDLRPHMESPDWTEFNAGIQQHLQKAYNTNKAAFKAQHWVIDPTTETYNVKKIRRARAENITTSEWDKQSSTTQEYPSLIDTFFMAHTVNGKFLRVEDRCIYEEMRRLKATSTYTDDEINRLARGGKQRWHILGVGRVLPTRATASPSTSAHESTLNSLHKKVDFMMSIFKSDSKYSDMFSQFESGGARGSGGCRDDEEGADHQDDEDEDDDGDT